MIDASGGGDQYPGQRPATADALLADLMLVPNPDRRITLAEELTTALGGVTTRSSGLELSGEWTADTAARLKTGQVARVVGSYGSRLQNVLGHVFGDEGGRLAKQPSAEQLQQVEGLDAAIRMAASHPVVVLKPGKPWLDVGLLERPESTEDNTGLQYYSNEKSATSAVGLPVQGTVTIDIKTGREIGPQDRRHDDEQDAWAIDEKGATHPVIDPLATRVLLAAEEARTQTDTELVSAYVLVGYTELQRTLNRVLGFEMDPRSQNQDKAKARFSEALRINRHLEQVGVSFDMDYIDGYLAYHIEALRQEIEEAGPLKDTGRAFREARIADMEDALARLTDSGRVAKPPLA